MEIRELHLHKFAVFGGECSPYFPADERRGMPRRAARQTKLFQNNLLIYGDNLKVLRNPHLFREESVDLVYLDPPFKPMEKYNVLFRARAGTPAAAQVRLGTKQTT